MTFQYEETPKYRKKKKSSISKSKKKSNHKHKYKEYLLVTKKNNRPYRANCCEICGKIGELHFFDTERIPGGIFRQLDDDEVFIKYAHLEQIKIESIWDKYISKE